MNNRLTKPLVFLGLLVNSWSTLAKEQTQPNVLFIAVDDLREWVGHLGGHPLAKTPNIDRLAQAGVSFTHAYCSAPLCNPSRISLLTGIAPYKSGVYGNGERLRDKLPEAVTLMEHFRASGYHVSGCGKIFHGTKAYDSESWDNYFVPARSIRRAKIQRSASLPEGAWAPWGPLDLRDEEMFDGKLANWVVKQLKANSEQPFFLACGFTKPHLPWTVPSKYFDLHPLDEISLPIVPKDDLADIPAFGRKLAIEVYDPSGERNFATVGGDHRSVLSHGQWKLAVQAYVATISFVDAQIGRLLDALEESQHADNTLVVLWGDHGWHLGEKEHWRKHALWDVSTRTPLIFAYPNNGNSEIPSGQLCDTPVSLIDIYPTLIDRCRLTARDGLDGRSLESLLKQPQKEWDWPVIMTHGDDNHAVRTRRWRYIRYRDGGEELYDHSKDPHEWRNLAGEASYSDVIEELQRVLPPAKGN